MSLLRTPVAAQPALVDAYGRRIEYLRLSVTDRCDFRCRYCMAEDMRFLPRQDTLGRDELVRVARLFVSLGTRKIRITGGEPLVRPDIVAICQDIAALPGLQELVLSTNGSHLATHAEALAAAGVRRLNISLDSLDPARFQHMTRVGRLDSVLAGIEAARQAGFVRIRLNCVLWRNQNEHELPALMDFALARGLDLCFIEEMPLGDVGRDRDRDLVPHDDILARLSRWYPLQASDEDSGGPARYWRVQGHPDSRIGLISPHSHNFCASCNRVRITAEGRLLLCLGHDHSLSLRDLLRAHPEQDSPLIDAITHAIRHKPERHHFEHVEAQPVRFMNLSGG